MLGTVAAVLSKTSGTMEHDPVPDVKFFTQPYKVSALPILTLPEVNIQLSGRPLEADMDVIKNTGGEARRIAGAAMDTWVVNPTTWDELILLNTITNIRENTAATSGSITIPMIPHMIQYISTICFIGELLRVISPQSPLVLHMDLAGLPLSKGKEKASEKEVVEVSEDSVMEVASTLPAGYQTMSVMSSTPWSLQGFVVEGLNLITNRAIFGTSDDCPTGHGGIFIPFEKSYASFDILIATHFVETFKSVFFRDFVDYEEESRPLLQTWASGLYQTRTGDYLAHMMKVLMMAKEAGTWAFFIITPDGLYQGAVIMGTELMVRLIGGRWVEALGHGALQKELESCGSHTRALQKILDYAGLVGSEPSQFKTMRSLSQAVNTGGAPAGSTMNLISKELPKLSFVEKPTAVNAQSIKCMMDLLTSDVEISDGFFMDRGFFFPKDRYEAVLTMFGSSAPSFNVGGNKEIRCCTIAPTRILALPYDRAQLPKTLQAVRVQVGACSNQWRDLLESGHINGVFDRETSGSRKFVGAEKEILWHAFDDFSRKVNKAKDKEVTKPREGPSLKRDNDEEDARAERLKKMKRFM
jgi:hypothetical protein